MIHPSRCFPAFIHDVSHVGDGVEKIDELLVAFGDQLSVGVLGELWKYPSGRSETPFQTLFLLLEQSYPVLLRSRSLLRSV